MQRFARTLRYLADLNRDNRLRADQHRNNQLIARKNAADASAALRQRRHDQDSVDAYLVAYHDGVLAEGPEPRRGGHGG
jgi:hypothetical protein